MPRPQKQKRVCKEPITRSFYPDGKKTKDKVILTIDEYETIRLIDVEGISREECANRMEIKRTTAQDIYNSARSKIADSLINGKELHIEGGNVVECDGTAGCECCNKRE